MIQRMNENQDTESDDSIPTLDLRDAGDIQIREFLSGIITNASPMKEDEGEEKPKTKETQPLYWLVDVKLMLTKPQMANLILATQEDKPLFLFELRQ